MFELGGDDSAHSAPVVTRPSYDHLSGFVPVNFDPSTSDGVSDGQLKDFSVVVGGDDSVRDPIKLAELLKGGRLDDKKAFIAPAHENVPDGKIKIQILFPFQMLKMIVF